MVARAKKVLGVSLHLRIMSCRTFLPLFSVPSMRLGVEDHETVKSFFPCESYPMGPCVEDHDSEVFFSA